MEPFEPFRSLIVVTASVLVILSVVCVEAQISTPCTSSISSFTPCMNFITGSSSNGSSTTADCCNSIKSLMTDSTDCACLVVTGNVPISLPINRTLALSLSRLCQISLPTQCKATGVPLPAPGPALFGPTISPTADSPFSPRASKAAAAAAPAPAPPPLGTADSPIEPASPPVTTAAAGIRPVKTPASAANPPRIPSPYIPSLMFMGILGLS